METLASLFNLLRGSGELDSPRVLAPEVCEAIGKVQEALSTQQAPRMDLSLHFKFVVMGKLLHLQGLIFQWDKARSPS